MKIKFSHYTDQVVAEVIREQNGYYVVMHRGIELFVDPKTCKIVSKGSWGGKRENAGAKRKPETKIQIFPSISPRAYSKLVVLCEQKKVSQSELIENLILNLK